MSESSSAKCRALAAFLDERYGLLSWWGGTADEVMIGAILVHQTRWENVEGGLERLRAAGLGTLAAIGAADEEAVQAAIRSTGFYRVKTRRLKALAAFVENLGGIEGMRSQPTHSLRERLLAVKGIGEETADSILCYALDRPCFVVDAYAERLCRCAGVAESREELRRLFESVLPAGHRVRHQAHAHIVEYARRECTKKRCDRCRIRRLAG